MIAQSRFGAQGRTIAGLFLTMVLINLCHPLDGIANLPVQFILKDTLHERPTAVAAFNAWASLPISLAWLAGLVRDTGRSLIVDRVYVFGGVGVCIACYLLLANGVRSYAMLLAATIVLSVSIALAKTTAQAVMVQVSKARALEDLASVVWNGAETLPPVVSNIAGAMLLVTFGAPGLFLMCALVAVMLLVCGRGLIGLEAGRAKEEAAGPRKTAQRIARTLKERSFLLSLLVIFLFTFSPGWQTPLLYYLTGTKALTTAEFAVFMSLVSGATILGALAFGVASRFVPTKQLLWISTILMVGQSPIPLLVNGPESSYVIGIASGLMYGFAIANYWALLIRASPTGLEGTAYMLAVFVAVAGVRGGDVLGSWMFEHGGFLLPMVITTVATALIAPTLWLMSRSSSKLL